jgi:hypothetical protein
MSVVGFCCLQSIRCSVYNKPEVKFMHRRKFCFTLSFIQSSLYLNFRACVMKNILLEHKEIRL